MHSHRMFQTVLSTTRCLLAGASVLVAALFSGPSFADDDGRPVKVMIINMFGGTAFPSSEASAFTPNLGLNESSRPTIPTFCATSTMCARWSRARVTRT